VGDLLIRLRKKKNLSQEELARQLGISASYLSLLENGKRPASMRVFRTLARYLRVPTGYLVLHDFRLEDLSERHRAIVRDVCRELMTPPFENLFGEDRERSQPKRLLQSKAGVPAARPGSDQRHADTRAV
jgi:transcriptional regulator with XRE-family HTH domain